MSASRNTSNKKEEDSLANFLLKQGINTEIDEEDDKIFDDPRFATTLAQIAALASASTGGKDDGLLMGEFSDLEFSKFPSKSLSSSEGNTVSIHVQSTLLVNCFFYSSCFSLSDPIP